MNTADLSRQDILRILIAEIEKKQTWGNSGSWTNYHFRELSEQIKEKTGKDVSESTLKRIFGKRKPDSEDYLPQAYTLTALAQHAGYDSYENFLKHRQADPQRFITKPKYVTATAIFVLLLFLLWFMNGKTKKGKFEVNCNNSTYAVPFTATFNYNIENIEDSIFTDFGIGTENYLNPKSEIINGFYPNAGIFDAIFYTRKESLDTVRIIALSDTWQGGWFPNDRPDLFASFNDQQIFQQRDYLFAPESSLIREGVDVSSKYWVGYNLVKPFDVSLDDMSFFIRLFNNESTGSKICYDSEIVLTGETGLIRMKLVKENCQVWANLTISDKLYDGRYTDLRSFAVDVTDWLDVGIETGNNRCIIKLKDAVIFEGSYEKPLGDFYGISIRFYGTGKIDSCRIADAGRIVYLEDFKGLGN